MPMQLYIGNKNYSSWSMRPWVLMKQAGIPFTEMLVRMDGFDAASEFRKRMSLISPTAKVPVLVDDGLAVWDTLAIIEYLAEKFPDRHLWPVHAGARARARSICAEMHAGFSALRSHFPMNIEAHLPEVGKRVLAESAETRADVQRVTQIWSDLLCTHGGPMLLGSFSAADAFFAPMAMRFKTYGISTPAPVEEYLDRIAKLPSVSSWIEGALAENDFLTAEEPYRNKT